MKRVRVDVALGEDGSSTRAESVDVGAADTAGLDLDVDIVVGEGLGLVLLPDHLAVNGLRAQAAPALKLVVGGHFDE